MQRHRLAEVGWVREANRPGIRRPESEHILELRAGRRCRRAEARPAGPVVVQRQGVRVELAQPADRPDVVRRDGGDAEQLVRIRADLLHSHLMERAVVESEHRGTAVERPGREEVPSGTGRHPGHAGGRLRRLWRRHRSPLLPVPVQHQRRRVAGDVRDPTDPHVTAADRLHTHQVVSEEATRVRDVDHLPASAVPVHAERPRLVLADRPHVVRRHGAHRRQRRAAPGWRHVDPAPRGAVPVQRRRLVVQDADRPDVVRRNGRDASKLVVRRCARRGDLAPLGAVPVQDERVCDAGRLRSDRPDVVRTRSRHRVEVVAVGARVGGRHPLHGRTVPVQHQRLAGAVEGPHHPHVVRCDLDDSVQLRAGDIGQVDQRPGSAVPPLYEGTSPLRLADPDDADRPGLARRQH